MNYQFLNKASNEPDLEDFTSYCKPLVETIENLQFKLKNFSVINKTTTINLDLALKIDKIINKYLPNLIDNFLELSIKTRNTQKNIELNNKFFTAKEILLFNLSTIENEVSKIESEIEETYVKNIKVQSKIIDSQLGIKPNININGELELSPKTSLNNTFDYNKFIENNHYKKPIQNTNETFTNETTEIYDESVDENKPTLTSGISLIEIILGLSFISLLLIMSLTVFTKIQTKKIQDDAISTLNEITSLVKTDKTYDPLKSHYEIFQQPLTIGVNDNHIIYEVKNINDEFCISLIPYAAQNLQQITINNNRVDSNNINMNITNLVASCQNLNNNVSFIVNLKK